MWSVALLKPQAAELAIVNLRRQGYDCFDPRFSVRKVWRNRVLDREEQVFPGYLFVRVDPGQRWSAVNYTLGIRRLLTRKSNEHEYDEPAPLPSGFVEGLRVCSVKHPEKNGSSLLMPGTEVRITGGPFSGRAAVVTWADADRVALLVWLLNRQVSVTVSLGDVAVV